MVLFRRRKIASVSAHTLLPVFLLAALLLLTACGGDSSSQTKVPTPTPRPPTPTPTAGLGQRILNNMANKLNTASTLHGEFDLNLAGQAFNGTINSEIWNATPNKNRTLILKSTISQFTTDSLTVTDGKTVWQYDPEKKVVYTGPVTAVATATGTPTPIVGGGQGRQGGQTQFLLNLVQSIFSQSSATLRSSSATINGHTVYDLHVVPGSTAIAFSYEGEIYVDKTTQLPVQVNLNIQGFGNIVLNVPALVLNQPIPDNTFTFVIPSGVKVLPLSEQNTTPGTGSLTFAQAQQQAGYHLLSIPPDQTDYVLNGVNALGTPGNQTYTLNYMKGNLSFTIVQGKPLANLPDSTAQKVTVRGTTGTLSSTNGQTTLGWTENGIGIRITGGLNGDQVQSIAKLLS